MRPATSLTKYFSDCLKTVYLKYATIQYTPKIFKEYKNMETEQINQLNNQLDDLAQRNRDIRDYMFCIP